MNIFITALIAIFQFASITPECDCKEVNETFLPYAKEGPGIPLYVEIVGIKRYHEKPAFAVNYLELKVLQNLSSSRLSDTLNLLIADGVECCLTNLPSREMGYRAVINAFEWDESDYGYLSNQLEIYCLSVCTVSYIPVIDGVAIGSITRKKEQRMQIDQFTRKLL